MKPFHHVCICGCRDETDTPDPPQCWGCERKMTLFKVREVTR